MGKMKIIGIVLSSIAVLAIIAVIIMSFAMPLGFWMGAEKAEDEYDNWASSAAEGDDITITGKIAEKEEAGGAYLYKMEGCDAGFMSSEDIGDEGSQAVVTIQVAGGAPQVQSQTRSIVAWGPNICCGVISLVLIILGLVLLLMGLKKDKKAALENPPQEAAPEGQPQPAGGQQQAAPQPVPIPQPDPPMDPKEAAKKRQLELNQKVAMQTGWNPGQPPQQ